MPHGGVDTPGGRAGVGFEPSRTLPPGRKTRGGSSFEAGKARIGRSEKRGAVRATVFPRFQTNAPLPTSEPGYRPTPEDDCGQEEITHAGATAILSIAAGALWDQVMTIGVLSSSL